MTGISKRFGAVSALSGVNLHVEPNTIHAIVGENGAGKSTLMRILYGAWQPDAGTLDIQGERKHFANTKEAIHSGVGMVSQHYAIIPELTCLENLILGAEGKLFLKRRAIEARARQLAESMGFQFEWDRPANELSPAGAQKLEILKLLWRDAQIMILDEPTAMLSPEDSGMLFRSLRQLTARGATVILVTHRISDVLDHCQSVTVLRGGKLIDEMPVANTDANDLAKLIIGRSLTPTEPPMETEFGAPNLTVQNLDAKGDRGALALHDVSLQARAGEIVGIAGVDGSGQRELFEAIAGIRPPRSGTIQPNGTPKERIRKGVRLIPEDRHEQGVIESWSLEENAALGLQWFSPLAVGSRINQAARAQWADAVAGRFQTRHGGLGLPMASLSGGNQQRFVAARAMGFNPKVLLAFQPARGLDMGATADVYRGIRETCQAGATALVVSFDLDELLTHCDRIVVMHRGTLVEPEIGFEKDRDAIGRLMVGAR
jgi:simple sugar transport system ATP-binding protein